MSDEVAQINVTGNKIRMIGLQRVFVMDLAEDIAHVLDHQLHRRV